MTRKFWLILGCAGMLFSYGCKKEAPAPLPTANFYVDNNGCEAPCSVYFYNQSINAERYEWYFGNGQSSTLEDDTAFYTVAKTYQIWLLATNRDDVTDTVRKTIIIN